VPIFNRFFHSPSPFPFTSISPSPCVTRRLRHAPAFQRRCRLTHSNSAAPDSRHVPLHVKCKRALLIAAFSLHPGFGASTAFSRLSFSCPFAPVALLLCTVDTVRSGPYRAPSNTLTGPPGLLVYGDARLALPVNSDISKHRLFACPWSSEFAAGGPPPCTDAGFGMDVRH
jgi:hypothetical protein